MVELSNINTDLLDYDLASTTLDFKDAAGQDKGSATLGERMEFFEKKVDGARVLIGELVAEREKVEAEVGSICCELRAIIEDGEVEGLMGKAEECGAMVERVVDAAVLAWDVQEGRYEREKAKNKEGMLKLCGEGVF